MVSVDWARTVEEPFYGAGYRWWRKAKVHDSRTLYIWWTFHAVSVKLRDRIILLWCKTIYSNSWRLSINHVEIRLWNEKLLFCSIIYYRANITVVFSIFIKTYDPIPLQTLRRLVLREIAPNLQKLLVLLLPRGLFSQITTLGHSWAVNLQNKSPKLL